MVRDSQMEISTDAENAASCFIILIIRVLSLVCLINWYFLDLCVLRLILRFNWEIVCIFRIVRAQHFNEFHVHHRINCTRIKRFARLSRWCDLSIAAELPSFKHLPLQRKCLWGRDWQKMTVKLTVLMFDPLLSSSVKFVSMKLNEIAVKNSCLQIFIYNSKLQCQEHKLKIMLNLVTCKLLVTKPVVFLMVTWR